MKPQAFQLDRFLERRPEPQEARMLGAGTELNPLMKLAATLRDRGHGDVVTYSPKVFVPLTVLCRDVCHYCTFAKQPRELIHTYLSESQVLEIARAGKENGCHEVLFTLGDKPELRYRAAREALETLGFDTTAQYLAHIAGRVFDQTGLLPHINAGILEADEMAALREVSASQGIMLESAAPRLSERGGPHYGSPDKRPEVRLANIELAGRLKIPFTTGILIGIGENRDERIDSLLKIRALHDRYDHIQELIIQPFRAKPDTLMAKFPEPDTPDLLWTIAVARILFGPDMNLQAPPNLSPGVEEKLIHAGINDWGGVSPVTLDHVNPEAPWPRIAELQAITHRSGKTLIPRLPVYSKYLEDSAKWLSPAVSTRVHRLIDGGGLPRTDSWVAGELAEAPFSVAAVPTKKATADLHFIFDRVTQEIDLTENDIVRLFHSRGDDFLETCRFADQLRRDVNGDVVTYVVNRNINYTNICGYRCGFCAFSKSSSRSGPRDHPYLIDLAEIRRRTQEAWHRGATEVCLQGGIHPDFTGDTYLSICQAIKSEVPAIHIHAFSPLEVMQGARTLGISIAEFLEALKKVGLSTLPGTAAEILDDEVRRVICPDKLTTKEWLDVIKTAHKTGLPTTATIMFGHVDKPQHWARHLIHIRKLQSQTGGFTEFVPLPFIHQEAPMYRRQNCRKGPTFRESVLMHAVARIVLHRRISNIQVSWTKMGKAGAVQCLRAGANDVGGTLMNESISRAAGNQNGQELPPEQMDQLIQDAGRMPQQRTTKYENLEINRSLESYNAPPLVPLKNQSIGVKLSDLLQANRPPVSKGSDGISTGW
ncbi:MAG TPA: 7,8-didemethyl-8-hydroxy-5-deazariboflavin synthase subunit CofH [Gammaproteobacteria bacterium]|nr:7,8-didemethyl-8-hydroxy-5-deazariboflavin synthase subunit CofH [Gammaproteobacteria bacterium]